MPLQTPLATELAETYRSSALREIQAFAATARDILRDSGKRIGSANLSEAKAHMADADAFAMLDSAIRTILGDC